jgi:hypothetical protein
MVEATPYESLPANWSSFDLMSFSQQKQLWDYQQASETQAREAQAEVEVKVEKAPTLKPQANSSGRKAWRKVEVEAEEAGTGWKIISLTSPRWSEEAR